MKLFIKAGATSRRIWLFIADTSSTTGAGLTGLTSGSSGLTAAYARDDQGNVGATSIALAAGTRGTWASGGFVEKDATGAPGVYELGLPDAMIASGAKSVLLFLKGATNMAPLPVEIQLTAVDVDDAVAFGLSRLDAAVSSRSTYAGADTSGVTTLLTRVPGVVPVAADYTSARAAKLDNLDATISSRGTSTYAGADTTGTTTLLGRVTAGRATNLDNLDAAVSTRSTYAGGDTAGTTTLLARLTAGRAGNLDFLDAAVSGIAAAVWAAGTRTLTSFGTVAADAAAAVWAAGARTLTAFGFSVTASSVSDKTGYALSVAPAVPGDAMTLTVAGQAAVADKLLGRNQKGGSDGPSGQTVSAAIAGGLMELSISGSTLTVKNADGTTAYTRTLTRQALDAIVGSA